jgi:type I restriction enzyme R subunit
VTDQDKLVYVNNVVLTKLLESPMLAQQPASNSREQFNKSPDLNAELMNALMDAFDAHKTMSTQALNSELTQAGILDMLLNHLNPWEWLRAKAG